MFIYRERGERILNYELFMNIMNFFLNFNKEALTFGQEKCILYNRKGQLSRHSCC